MQSRYLHCEKRLSDAGPFDSIWFEDSRRNAVAEFLQSDATHPYLQALAETTALIDGFESPLGMELLATVDWLLFKEGAEPTVPGLRAGLNSWPGGKAAGRRKSKLFDARLLELALGRLTRV